MTLFDAEWIQRFADAWNADSELTGALEKIGFNSVIGYGFTGGRTRRGVSSPWKKVA
ncbi:hypothetical protein SAMN05443662_0167 [Sulfurivirga caldicuralii]|uniref:Uncharacterized protein n=1 Tax=Sulfurivirga caldicuralii TaxID=364032 RepID=A0A1N6DI71_9GAMM|nr:hypothetical protein [Sulfurivirga caldicuralii]SIN70480.1 hypothetical protein SAMN05443662_0167 [Sulfurivirga caldicuralii]